MASKPYAATGKYIYANEQLLRGLPLSSRNGRTGADACPFTTLYWDFLTRHREHFERHPRLALQVRNLDRLSAADRTGIAARVAELRQTLDRS